MSNKTLPKQFRKNKKTEKEMQDDEKEDDQIHEDRTDGCVILLTQMMVITSVLCKIWISNTGGDTVVISQSERAVREKFLRLQQETDKIGLVVSEE